MIFGSLFKRKDGVAGKILIQKDGPYLVSGGVSLGRESIGTNAAGESAAWEILEPFPAGARYELCRCGHSRTKPFCDLSHLAARFDGIETADRRPFAQQAGVVDGPTLELHDVEPLCATARFCMRGKNAWQHTRGSGDPADRAAAIAEACQCPSGRLVAVDRPGGVAVDPPLPPSIAVVEDPSRRAMGPLWVKGGIPVIAVDGHRYEPRNRVTLCRCGKSKNKPFCDGSHLNGAASKGRDG